ncbi:MAG: sugar ABC transporter substrate-binding protein [Candidatus Poribacteria bacterium]|nr:MAG: sugar ABC transporter substrate-binding protein [Candidatus Poribacteria bacterium]
MDERFPLGRGPLVMLILFLISSFFVVRSTVEGEKEVLEFWVFANTHYDEYKAREAAFEAAHPNVDVRITNFGGAMHDKLLAALLSGFGGPDLAEVEITSIGRFLKGPIDQVGFVDLKPRLLQEGWWDRHVTARFAPWSYRGRTFGLPHDLHPVVLLYRHDLFQEAGIHMEAIETWDQFVQQTRPLAADLDGDGLQDRYPIVLGRRSHSDFFTLLLQRGGGMFDEQGEIIIDRPLAVQTLEWYARLFREGVARDYAGVGGYLDPATFALLRDGLACSVLAPDWYIGIMKKYFPEMAGAWRARGLPRWEPGGRRTSTFGGTMIGMTVQCKNPDLAWEYMKFSYFDRQALVNRYEKTGILPPLKEAWDDPVFHRSDPFFGGQQLGTLLIELAEEIPPRYQNPYWSEAADLFDEAVLNVIDGKIAPADSLRRLAEQVRRLMEEDRLSGS